ncbi:MAG: energy-coupling factor transporter transmembrane protein EcfT [Treponema sp.]|nr:energy-coupling factor transporter transmembrane protein EcfT [Treponema sp.]
MSVFYKIDPRVKIFIVLLFTVLIFIIDRLMVTVFLMSSFLILRLAAKIPFRRTGYIKMFSMLAVFIIVVQILFYPGEKYILRPLFPSSFPLLGGMGALKLEGLFSGLTICFRLTALMLLLPMFTVSTTPEKISAALVSFGLNYRVAFIITSAFNMIPLFEEEGRIIMDAQKLRGMSAFESRFFLTRLKAYPALVVPLVLCAMRKAQLVSVVMDSRAFGVYKTRTWLPAGGERSENGLKLKRMDYLTIVFCVIFSVIILFLNFLPFREYFYQRI